MYLIKQANMLKCTLEPGDRPKGADQRGHDPGV